MAPVGRPPKAEKQINPVRQVGRWDDESWQEVRDAAEVEGKSVAAWARVILLRAARRTNKRTTRGE